MDLIEHSQCEFNLALINSWQHTYSCHRKITQLVVC